MGFEDYGEQYFNSIFRIAYENRGLEKKDVYDEDSFEEEKEENSDFDLEVYL